jgi:hypothetical protein
MEIAEAHADELADAESRGVEQLDQRAVAQAKRRR